MTLGEKLWPALGTLGAAVPVPLAPLSADDLFDLARDLQALYPGRLAWRMSKATRRRLNEVLRRRALPAAHRRRIRASVRYIERSRRWWKFTDRRWA